MLERALISGITRTTDEIVYRVAGASPARLFSALADAGVNVDTIVQTDERIVFSAPSEDDVRVRDTLDTLGGQWSADAELGKVSVVGAGMKSHPGVAATTFATLGDEGIEPVMVTTSSLRITYHVRKADVDRATRALEAAVAELQQAGEAAGA
jgi:aspartate kinase